MNRAGLLALCMVLGCGSSNLAATPGPKPKPLLVSMLPAKIDIEKLIPPRPPKTAKPVGERFEELPVDEGNKCGLPPGFLIDETTYSQMTLNEATIKWMEIELATRKHLRQLEREAIDKGETAYQERVVEVERENAELRAPSLWGRIKGPFYYGLGLATMYAAVKVAPQ